VCIGVPRPSYFPAAHSTRLRNSPLYGGMLYGTLKKMTNHIVLSSLAIALTVLVSSRLAVAQTNKTTSESIAEIVVTVKKYKSTVLDTPIGMSARSGDQLAAQGLTTVSDVTHDVPGLTMRTAGPGLTESEARGLASTGGAAPTVGFYLDEGPLSPRRCRSPVRSSSTRTSTTSIVSKYCVDRRAHCTGPDRWA
jgi:hypothetical protein